MDRFAFLACQPYLLPPHRTDDGAARDTRARRSAVARGRDTAGGPTDKSHDAPCGVHRSGASSFACCASFHFSQAEQYAPSVSPDAKGSPTGAWERPDIVGAATDDALHLAFARTDSNPDQAQLTCELTVRERHSSSSPPSGGCVDVILDGARFELDMRQCRAVVEGFPPGNSSDEGSECGSMKHNDDDDDAPGGRVDVILDGARFELDMRQCRAVVEGFPPGSSSDEGSECGSMKRDDDCADDCKPPPYVSCVFSHVTLNLYRPRGTTGGAKERDAVRAMRRALERARAVAWSDGQSDVSPATDERESRRANWTTSTPPQWRVGAGILCDAVLGAVPVGEEGSALTDAASALAYAAARGRGREWSRRRANPGDAAL